MTKLKEDLWILYTKTPKIMKKDEKNKKDSKKA